MLCTKWLGGRFTPKIPFAGKNHRAQNLVVEYLQFHHGVFTTPRFVSSGSDADS